MSCSNVQEEVNLCCDCFLWVSYCEPNTGVSKFVVVLTKNDNLFWLHSIVLQAMNIVFFLPYQQKLKKTNVITEWEIFVKTQTYISIHIFPCFLSDGGEEICHSQGNIRRNIALDIYYEELDRINVALCRMYPVVIDRNRGYYLALEFKNTLCKIKKGSSGWQVLQYPLLPTNFNF